MSENSADHRTGLVLVICAPSGTGKSTLVKKLVDEFPEFAFSVSCTTREPRGQEQDGVDYHFLDVEEFKTRRDAGEFAEWAEVHGNFYGTPVAPVRDDLAHGRNVLFDIDVQGAFQLRYSFPEGLYVFLMPPSSMELERRLRGRGTDEEEAIAKRMRNARTEMEAADKFDYWIVNDDLDVAYDELRAVFLAGSARADSRPGLLAAMLEGWK